MGATGPTALNERDEPTTPRGRFHWPSFAADAALVSGGALTANILNYIFHFVLSRKLGPDGYGSLATSLAIAMVVGVVGSSIGTAAMQETARLWAAHEDETIVAFGRRLLRSAVGIGFVVGVVVLVLSVPLAHYLHIEDRSVWLWLDLALIVGIVAAYARGAIQGAHRFGFYAGSLVAESAIKLTLGFWLVTLGFGVAGAVAGIALGLVGGLIVALAPFFGGPAAGGRQYRAMQFGVATSRLAVIYAALMALTFVDTLFAKHALSGNEAGYYTAAGLVARIIPFGIGLIVPLVTPKAAAALHTSQAALMHLLAIAFGLALGGTVAVLAAMEVWPAQLVGVTFGHAFAPAAPLLQLYAVDTSLLALGLFCCSYLAAVGEYDVGAWLVAALVLEAAAMAVWGTTAVRLLTIAIAGNALVLPVAAALVARSLRRAPQAPGPPHAEMSNTAIL